jgi:hypothetical protein
MYLGLHPPKHEKLHPFSFYEHLSSPHWPMSVSYPRVQILHRCVVFSLHVEPIKLGANASDIILIFEYSQDICIVFNNKKFQIDIIITLD